MTHNEPTMGSDDKKDDAEAVNGNEGVLIPSGGDTGDGPTKRAVRRGEDSSKTATTRRKLRKSKKKETSTITFIKYAALFLLVAQMVGLVLLMRYSRTHADPEQPLYLASTAVFLMEAMKLFICFLVIAYQSGSSFLKDLYHHTVQSPLEVLKLCVPSLLYTVQNNLLYLALTNLDAATYQVCYQLKILTTAIFSATLLGRKFSAMKWASLVVLTVGVAIVQLSGSGDSHAHRTATRPMNLFCLSCSLSL